ncbi:hypothetical protein CVT24_002677 [Panaeolus cyanescens]|uniref:Arrestin-like N-terminal domain-containing protein n=1 Tax=Panaeolus cyanescens TaxID=181874 RepID=A0A409WBA8_9AGAR|nr:hypothetical protein CVT24_002677 [Panaeolus cyanescens]
MSTLSLSSYAPPSINATPAYTAEPQDFEQRIALADRLRPRPAGNFIIKNSKKGEVTLRLNAQEEDAVLPVYGSGGLVEGAVELAKTDGVTSVEVKIEGTLLLKEIAEGGTAVAKLCLNTQTLWVRDAVNTACPSTLRFAISLPNAFDYEDKNYPLPPTFHVKLSGLPGFIASIEYSVTAIIGKPNGPLPKVKSKALGIHIGSIVVSTPFIYYPRTRPALQIPPPLSLSLYQNGFEPNSDWKCTESVIPSKSLIRQDILVKLYIPASRIFCMGQPIPFHLSFESSAVSLAAFLPMAPSVNTVSKYRSTRVQLMRQTTVDVRNTVMSGVKTDMWRVDCIAEGTFKHAGDGPTWIAFKGEMIVDEEIKVAGFRAAGLSVKDCILLTVTPHDPIKSPFGDLREVIPVKLATDPWSANGAGIGAQRDSPAFDIPTPPLGTDGGM